FSVRAAAERQVQVGHQVDHFTACRELSPDPPIHSGAWWNRPCYGWWSTLHRVPILGSHVDSSGGLHLAFGRAAAMGAEAIQVHPTPPNFWGSPKLDDDRVERFRLAAAEAGHPPFYFHAVYLINLAGDDPMLRQRSESTLAGSL